MKNCSPRGRGIRKDDKGASFIWLLRAGDGFE